MNTNELKVDIRWPDLKPGPPWLRKPAYPAVQDRSLPLRVAVISDSESDWVFSL